MQIYVFRNAHGNIQDWAVFDLQEAEKYARQHGYKCIVQNYEWIDSEVICDFIPKGAVETTMKTDCEIKLDSWVKVHLS